MASKGQQASSLDPPAGHFSVYQHPTLTRIFTAQSLKPKLVDLAFTWALFLLSTFGFLFSWQCKHAATANLEMFGFEKTAAEACVICAQALSGLATLASMAALYKAYRLHAAASFRVTDNRSASATTSMMMTTPPPSASAEITDRQRILLGAPKRLNYSPSSSKPTDLQQQSSASKDFALRQRPPKHNNNNNNSNKQSSPSMREPLSPLPASLLAPVHPMLGASPSTRWGPMDGQLFLSGKGTSPSQSGIMLGGGTTTPPPSAPTPPLPEHHPPRGILSFTSPPPTLRRPSPPPVMMSGGRKGGGGAGGFPVPRGSTPPPIESEESLENFLAEVDYQMIESLVSPGMMMMGGGEAQGMATGVGQGTVSPFVTPPPSGVAGVGGIALGRGMEASGATPGSGVPPTRSFQVSPSAQKVGVSPKKREGGLPPPLSPPAFVEELRKLGVDLQDLEAWRDRLRQWMSEYVLSPLLAKILCSPGQVMEAAAKLGIQVMLNSWGASEGKDGGTGGGGAAAIKASLAGNGEAWEKGLLQGELMEEDLLLQRLRDGLVHERDAPPPPAPMGMFGLQSAAQQQKAANPVLQQCIEVVMEHQRLRTLLKGEWAKGLLPQSSVPITYTIQRIAELAEGTCVRSYEWAGGGNFVTAKKTKKWSSELPTDSHLLLYLFAALLEHPKWVLLQSDSAYSGGSSPLFVASLPSKVPDKYIAILPWAPPMPLNAGPCVLAANKAIPALFALYWDKKAQLTFQGRSALWDAILLFVHRIKVGFGGTIRGVSLGSPSLGLLDLLEPCTS